MQYRRAFVPGGSFFFTVVTEQRRPILATDEAVTTLRAAFRHVQYHHPFTINAMVVLPDHLHCIWTLPPGDNDFPSRWRLIKTWFTKHCDPSLRGITNQARINKNQQAIWQHRYWEHLLRDETDFARHVEYIHFNPVKHGYSKNPIEWPYSSFHRYVENGIYLKDWGCNEKAFDNVGHE